MDDITKRKMHDSLIAPCGMNCRICIGYFGYTISGRKRKNRCIGCKPRDKSCALVKKSCKKLTNKEIDYCYECKDFPCNKLKKLDKRYREKYKMSMIKNLENIEENGINKFLKSQEEKYKCPKCQGIICVHNDFCYSCNSLK